VRRVTAWFGLIAALVAADALARPECGAGGTTPLAAIIGMGEKALPAGREVEVEALVSGRFPGDAGLNGFYLASESSPAGLFVYAPDRKAAATPQRHTRWRIRAHTGRYRSRAQLERIVAMTPCGQGTVRPTPLEPGDKAAYERLRDRPVRLDGPLSIAEVYNLGRYGTLRLARGGRPFHPNNGVDGGERLDLLLDDGSYQRDPRPVPHTRDGIRRAGDGVADVTGILTHAFGRWRIHPTETPALRTGNPRPPIPARGPGLRLVQLNLKNYFTDRSGRGAQTDRAFQRQRQRLKTLVEALDADVLALHEVQNNTATVDNLVSLLNASTPPADDYRAAVDRRGDAVIRSVLLYRPDRLNQRGAERQSHPAHPRQPIAVGLETPEGRRFRVAVAHFKSRGGCPRQGDIDRGEGCWAERRRDQSRAMIDWLGTLPDPATPLLVLSDLNAYPMEQAVGEWTRAGYVDLLARHVPPADRYTYNYHGRAGYLDHALANRSLLARIASVSVWPINADEPEYLAGEGNGVWRLSDHDPIIIDLHSPTP
jgi:predicted extracellular nuclease